MAEVIKHGAIRDAALFEQLERDLERVLALEDEALVLDVLERAVRSEGGRRVRGRARDRHPRMLLNFGHTLGHAVEALRGYRGVLHGEAVAMGMVFAARRSEALGIAPAGLAERLGRCSSGPGSRRSSPPSRAGLISRRCVSIRRGAMRGSASSC